jgi:hypothetical protein
MPEIDDVVRAVHADTPRMTEESFTAGRERVLAGRKPKRRGRLAAIAAGIAVLVAAALIIPTFGGEQAVSAATVLNKAADVIQATDVRLAPGQAKYFRMETVRLGSTERCRYQERDVDEIWIPHEQEAEWLLRRDRGQIQWLTCADPGSGTLPRRHQQEYRAKYGTFDGGADPAGWYNLTPQFLESLPRDPQALYELIQQEYAKTAEPSKAYFQHATHLLQSAALPADLRATLYRAMTLIPGVEITEELATVDGRKGTAIGLPMGSKGDIREDIVINPADGTLIGIRATGSDGNLSGWSLITHGVTEGMGQPPMR